MMRVAMIIMRNSENGRVDAHRYPEFSKTIH